MRSTISSGFSLFFLIYSPHRIIQVSHRKHGSHRNIRVHSFDSCSFNFLTTNLSNQTNLYLFASLWHRIYSCVFVLFVFVITKPRVPNPFSGNNCLSHRNHRNHRNIRLNYTNFTIQSMQIGAFVIVSMNTLAGCISSNAKRSEI